MRGVGDNVQVVRNTATISIFNVLGLISGLAVDVLLAARFGLGEEVDALFSALTVPQLVFAVLTMAFNAVLVPTFSHALAQRGKEGAWQLFASIATIAWVLVAGLALLGVLVSPSLVLWMFPGLTGTTRELTVYLSRIAFWMLLPAGVIQAASAMLNTYHRFAPPAALNLVQYSVVLVLAWLGIPKWGIAAVAAGYVVAAFVQLLMMAVALWSIGGRYRPAVDWRDPEVRNVGRLLLPLLAQSALGQSSTVVERLLASYLPPGTIAAVAYARRILRAVTDVFLNTVSTALLPRFSALSARNDVPGLKRAMGFGVRLASFVTLPAVTLLVALNVPIVRLAFQRGAFDASATQITAGIMGLYVLSVPPLAIFQIMVNTFFAMRDAATPIYLRLVVLAVNLVLDVAFIAAMGPYGLALSLLLARCAGMIGAFLALRRRVGALKLRLGEYFLKLGLAIALLAAVTLAVHWFWEGRGHAGLLQQLLAVCSASLLGLLAYGAVTVRIGIAEVDQAVALIKKRLAGRRVAPAGQSGRTPE